VAQTNPLSSVAPKNLIPAKGKSHRAPGYAILQLMETSLIEITIGDSLIRIATTIRKNATASTWLVFLHGLQSNREMFDGFSQDGRFNPFSILSIDLIGFGESDKPESFSYDLWDQAKVVAQVASQLNIGHMFLIGHSLGGMVATIALRKNDSRIIGIVSMEGNLAGPDCGKSAEVAALSFNEFQKQYPLFIDEISKEPKSGSARSNWMRQIPDFVFYKSSKSIVDWAKSGEIASAFASHSVPRSLIKGAKSSFKSKAPDGVFVYEIAGAGHFMVLDAPDETMTAVLRFLETSNP